MLLKSSDDSTNHRILWVSDDRTFIYLFNITAMSMPEAMPYDEMQKMLEDGLFNIQADDPLFQAPQRVH
jgi:hypothetical protein